MRPVTLVLVIGFASIALSPLPSSAVTGGITDTSDNQGRTDRTNSSVTVDAHDRRREPGYSGPVYYQKRTTKQCVSDKAECEIPIVIPKCEYEHSLGKSYEQIRQEAEEEIANLQPGQGTFNDTCINSGLLFFLQRAVPLAGPQDEAAVIDWVKDYFRRTQLPNPQPQISAPNGGICGVIHTVDMHMPVEVLHQEASTPFGPMQLHLYGKVTVDWGDGTKDTYASGGGPFPNSAIKHFWTTRGFYNIEAQANWTASYTIGPYNGYTYSGALSGVTTSGSIDNFRVWEAQAMLIN